MTGKTLSVLVVAHNEEARLDDCLSRLSFANELVVVLDKCTDGSKEIAARYTDHLVEGSWDLEGERRNTGIAACHGDWILEVDADEWIPPELGDEVRRTIETSTADWHLVPVDNYIGKRLVRYGWGASFGTSSDTALFRKGVKTWGPQRVHPSIIMNGVQGPRLETPYMHFLDRNISDMIRRLDSYTTARARDLRASGDIGNFSHNLRRIFSRFWKCYVGRKGYREGEYGFLIALLAGLYPVLSYLKARYEDD